MQDEFNHRHHAFASPHLPLRSSTPTRTQVKRTSAGVAGGDDREYGQTAIQVFCGLSLLELKLVLGYCVFGRDTEYCLRVDFTKPEGDRNPILWIVGARTWPEGDRTQSQQCWGPELGPTDIAWYQLTQEISSRKGPGRLAHEKGQGIKFVDSSWREIEPERLREEARSVGSHCLCLAGSGRGHPRLGARRPDNNVTALRTRDIACSERYRSTAGVWRQGSGGGAANNTKSRVCSEVIVLVVLLCAHWQTGR